MSVLPDKKQRVIAVIAALRAAAQHDVRDYVDDRLQIPSEAGVYLFCAEPGKDGVLWTVDNWFGTLVAIYAGKAGNLACRLPEHRHKWSQVLARADRPLTQKSLETYGADGLSLRWATFEAEPLVAETTLIQAIEPIGSAPVISPGGFGGDGDPGTWTLLGNVDVAHSLSLDARLEKVRDHTAPFLNDRDLIEEFSRTQYYYDLGVRPG